MFTEPYVVEPNTRYAAITRMVSNHSSACGSGGQDTVEHDSGVIFRFFQTPLSGLSVALAHFFF